MPPASPRRRAARAAAALAAAAALLASAPGPAADGDEAPDPVPLRRVLLAPERVAEAMGRAGQGALRRLPRAEFEALARKAARAAAAGPPRLVEARYRAELADGSLSGSGQWRVVHEGPGPALLPLRSLDLALRQPRFENRDALVADFGGDGPALLVDRPGEQTVAVSWSARGEERPGGLHFDLRIPPCPVAVLELSLPADRSVAGGSGELVTGPLPAESPDRRLWKVGCGGLGRADLWVRRSPGDGAAPLAFARLEATQSVAPEGVDAAYRFELDVVRGGGRELAFDCDPSLRPVEVTHPALESWELQPPPRAGAPARLAVRLRGPLREGREELAVRCLAPLSGPPAPGGGVYWSSPALTLAGAVPSGERLRLLFHPALRPEDFRAGGYRTAPAPPGEGDEESAWQAVTLTGGGLAGPGGVPERPSARLRPAAAEYRARQLAWWQLAPGPESLTVQISYEVEHGRLFQLPVLLPAGWEVKRVDLSPAGLLRNWTVRGATPPEAAGGGGTLVVDLLRPLAPGGRSRVGALLGPPRAPTLTVRLRRPQPAPEGAELPFPDARPLGARAREALLALDYDPQVNDAEAAVKPPAAEADPGEEGPWAPRAPDRAFACRGGPVEGSVRLSPRPARLHARCVSEVFLAAGRAAVEAELTLEAESGSPSFVDVALSAPSRGREGAADGGWVWSARQGGNGVARTERLPADASGPAAVGPAGAAALRAALPGERWRLHLDHPLRAGEPLLLRATHPLDPDAGRWEVPLPSVPGADRMEGEVTLHLAGADPARVEAAGLREAPPVAAARRGDGAWRSYRYGPGAVSLTLRGVGPAPGHAAEAAADAARLTSTLTLGGALRHHFAFRVTGWTGRTLPVKLPGGARAVAAAVDGHWLPAAVPAGGPEEEVIELPVPRGSAPPGEGHRFEVVYATDPGPAGGWGAWAVLAAPAPDLPVTPPDLRRTWRLPPGVGPLGGLRRLPGYGDAPAGPGDLASLPAAALRPLPGADGLLSGPAADDAESQREALADAARSLAARRAGQRPRLGEVVDAVDEGYLRGRLVVDAAALREAGAGPDTPVRVPDPAGAATPPPWESARLAALPVRGAALLTSDYQARLWQSAGGAVPPPDVAAAVSAAAARGRDPSGRFHAAADWARPAGPGVAPPLLAFDEGPGPWSAWEPLAGADPDRVAVAREGPVAAAGLAAAAALLLAVRRSRRRPHLLLAGMALAGLAAVWLPAALRPLAAWPLAALAAAALLGYVRAATRRPAPPPPPPRSSPFLAGSGRGAAAAGGAAALLLLALCAADARPQPGDGPGPATVYLLPAPADAPDRQEVLAPVALLERLERLARAGQGEGPDGVVLVAASYEGVVEGDVARFDAAFEAFGGGDGPRELALGLGGVDLGGEVWVDGARALPVALEAPKAGYALPVRGRGRHKIELKFRVPVARDAEGRSVRFAVPRAAQGRIRLRAPAGASHLRAPVRQGVQFVTATPEGPVLEAELGRVSEPAVVRWAEGGRPAGKVRFREAYLWELGAESSTLAALIDYRVEGGTADALAVELPPGLEPRSAEARRVPPPADAPPGEPDTPVRMRDWRVDGPGGRRVLRVELAAPAAGAFQLSVALAPRGPLPAAAELPLPAPEGEPLPDGGYVAYRTRGVEARIAGFQRVTAIDPRDFAPFWPAPSRPDPDALRPEAGGYAGQFVRGPRESGPPLLRLRLAPAPPRLAAEQEVVVRVGARQADVQASAELSAPGGGPAVVAWEVPTALAVAAVRGPDVIRWGRTGDRVEVWLRPGAATRVELAGWLPLTPGEGGTSRLDLPAFRFPAARSLQTVLRMAAAGGLVLAPHSLRHLAPRLPDAAAAAGGVVARAAADLGGPGAPAVELAYATARPDFAGAWEARPASADTAVRVLTIAELRERRLTFRTAVEYRAARGRLRAVSVRLRHADGRRVTLDAPGATVRQDRQSGGERVWSLDLPAAADRYRLTLTASVPPDEARSGASFPDFDVPGAAAATHWLAVAGPDPAPEDAAGLTPVDDAPAALRESFPVEAAALAHSGGAAWRTDGPGWRLRAVPRARDPGLAPAEVLLAEHAAALADGRRWLHESRYRLRHAAPADLTLTLPADAVVASVAVDGRDVAPLQTGGRRLWLPLPGPGGLREVVLRWRYDPGAETPARPDLTPPALEGAAAGPAVWTLFIPPGFEASADPGGTSPLPGAARAAAAELARADADLTAADGPVPASSRAAARRRAAAALGRAGRLLASGHARDAGGAPGGRTLGAWLAELQERARRPVRPWDEADPGPPDGRGVDAPPVTDEGTPAFYGPVPAGGPGPRCVLVPAAGREGRSALAFSAAWLGILAAAGALLGFPALLTRLRPFWPEPLLFLGALGWYLLGPAPAALLLVALGLGARLLSLARAAGGLLHRAAAP